MFNRKYAVLIVFITAVFLALPLAVFSAEKAAKDVLLSEIGKNPDVLKSAVLLLGDGCLRKNKTDEALAIYENALKVLPESEDLLNRAIDIYNKKADYSKAAELYKKMTELKPDNIANFQKLAAAYKNAGQKDKAIIVWENLTKSSNNAGVFMQAANFYSGENDMEKAIAAVKRASELAPDNMSYLQAIEGFYVRANKFTEAESVCSRIRADAKDQRLKDWTDSELLNIYQKQNKLEDLAARFEKELNQSPKDMSKYKRLANVYQRNNEQGKVVVVYEKAIAAGLDDINTNNRLLEQYEWSNKLDKAETQLRKIISMSLDKDKGYLYERLANLLSRAGKKEDAKKTWEQILAKSPNDVGVISRYGDKLSTWGDIDGAVAQYRKAQAISAGNLGYTMRIADIFIAKNNFDAARKELNDIMAKTTDSKMKQEAERKLKGIELSSLKPAETKKAR